MFYSFERAIGSSFPNPTVASLIIESDKNYMNNQIKSFGITNKGGRPHAEYNAISKTNFLEKQALYNLHYHGAMLS